MLSIASNAKGERLWVHLLDIDGIWKVKDWKLVDNTDFGGSLADETLSHAEVTGVDSSGADLTLDVKVVPVRPSLYPKDELSFEVFQDSEGNCWGIATDKNSNTFTFFKKPNIFGNYWVCAKVNSSKTMSERLNEKVAKGYRQVGSGDWRYNPNDRSVIRIF